MVVLCLWITGKKYRIFNTPNNCDQLDGATTVEWSLGRKLNISTVFGGSVDQMTSPGALGANTVILESNGLVLRGQEVLNFSRGFNSVIFRTPPLALRRSHGLGLSCCLGFGVTLTFDLAQILTGSAALPMHSVSVSEPIPVHNADFGSSQPKFISFEAHLASSRLALRAVYADSLNYIHGLSDRPTPVINIHFNIQFRPRSEAEICLIPQLHRARGNDSSEPPTPRNHPEERRLGPILTDTLHPHVINPSYLIPDRASTRPVEAMDSKSISESQSAIIVGLLARASAQRMRSVSESVMPVNVFIHSSSTLLYKPIPRLLWAARDAKPDVANTSSCTVYLYTGSAFTFRSNQAYTHAPLHVSSYSNAPRTSIPDTPQKATRWGTLKVDPELPRACVLVRMYEAGTAMCQPCPPRRAWAALEGGLYVSSGARTYTVRWWMKWIRCAGSSGRRRRNERKTQCGAASVQGPESGGGEVSSAPEPLGAQGLPVGLDTRYRSERKTPREDATP
ncbi:hypothetical protein B0H13DRAFT_2281800 [Mycena leptocephala]|nr:hypothetical protein B0H13DRAFT_2281800 [Mycena leptocephala]